MIQQRQRRRQRPDDELQRRAERALWYKCVSCRRDATHWTVQVCHQGHAKLLEALRDPNRRPPLPRDPLPQVIREHQPSVSFALDAQRFAVKYIKNHFHLTTTFIKQPLSSNNHFHQTTTFIKQPLSSNNQFHQTTTFIKNHLHQKPISSKNQFHQKTNFIKNQFHQKPISSETNFIRKK